MWNYTYSDELYHYGVPGMKWGVRRVHTRDKFIRGKKVASKGEAADKSWRTGVRTHLYNKKKHPEYEAEAKAAEAKAVKLRAENKEFKTYVKNFRKHGLPGSAMDELGGNSQTKQYNKLVKEKGKEYADRVLKKADNQLTASLVGSSIVAAGAAVAAALSWNQTIRTLRS